MYFNFARTKRITRHVLGVVLLGSVLVFSLKVTAAGQEPGLAVAVPEDARLADTHTMRLGKLDVNSRLYFTAQPLDQVVIFYKIFFAREGFLPVFDKSEKPKRLLRFKRNDEVVSIALRPQGAQTQIVIARYLQPFGAPSPEETRFSWGDLVQSLPKKDQTGTDISIVPRPPQSVRLGGGKLYNITMLLYSTQGPPGQICEFYKLQMAALGWQLAQEYDMGKKSEEFKREFPKKLKPAQINLPFTDVTFEQLISGGRMLIFTGERGEAELMMVNSLSKGQETLVLIKLTEKNAKK